MKRSVSYGLLALWLLGDLIHARYVASRLRAWEASVRRRPDGVQRGCGAYTVGRGADAILLVHGINDSPRCFYKMAPALAGQGHTCRVMRLPGFAEPLPKYARATWPQWRAAVENEVEGLREKHQRVVIVAHSLGTAVTIAAALDKPSFVDGVVLLAPAIQVSNQRSLVFPTRFWHRVGRRALFFTRTTYSPFDADCRDEQERDYPGRMVFTPLTIVDQTFELIDHNRGRAAEFKTPLMMVLTKDDQVIDWQAAQRFYEQASSQRKEIRFLENSGHLISVDFDWKDVTQEIADFVQTL